MKKTLLGLATLALLLAGCKKEDEGEKVTWVKIETSYDTDGKGPEGEVCVYDLTHNKITDYTAYRVLDRNYKPLHWIKDVNDESVYPTYIGKLHLDKDQNTGKYINKSSTTIFSYELTTADKYLIVIDLDSSPRRYTYKVIDWPKSKGFTLSKVFEREDKTNNWNRYYVEW